MKYDKLVRDKIPEIIERSGKTAVTRRLNDDEFKIYLEKKLDEEVAEYHESKSIEELADILQVVVTLCNAHGKKFLDLVELASMKVAARGVFNKKILLIEVRETESRNDE